MYVIIATMGPADSEEGDLQLTSEPFDTFEDAKRCLDLFVEMSNSGNFGYSLEIGSA